MSGTIGIDIAKDTFDVCLLDEQGTRHTATMTNNRSGHKALHRWLKKRGAQGAAVCLEATGIYGEELAETLHARGYRVSVVNPARIKAYAASQLQRNKTDRLDAAVIADFCRTQDPPLWTPPPPELKELRALVRHRDDLKQERQRARNRREVARSPAVVAHWQDQIALLDQQIVETEALIREHVDQYPDLKRQRDLLTSIPGIGPTTAHLLLAELGDLHRFDNVRQVVAFVGLNPRLHQSGHKRVTQGISRMGRASLRAALYMPAIVAKQHNPHLAAWAEGLALRGKTGKQVIVAVMRKLLHLAYGILKSGRAFDINHHPTVLPVAA